MAYQKDLEQGKIDSRLLPPCVRCGTASEFFKPHAFRERIFRVLVNMIVKMVNCALIRFRCPGCGKTFTFYPSFALPYKRFTLSTILHCSRVYVENEHTNYVQSAMIHNEAPGYEDDGKILSPSTVHRWITTLSDLKQTLQSALDLIIQANPDSGICREQAWMTVCPRKYRSRARKEILLGCRRLFHTEKAFMKLFEKSIFTRLARCCAFA